MERADDWLTVVEAAALTGESERNWQRRAAWEGKSAQREHRTPLAELRSAEEGGKPVWHVHRSFDVGLTRIPATATRDDRQRPALLTRYAKGKVERAYRKAYWLHEWRKLCEGRGEATEAELAERIVADAKRIEGDNFGVSFRTLQLWRRAYYAAGADGYIRGVAALLDQRGDKPAGGGAHPPRTQEAIDYFYTLYHARQQFTVKQCHKATLGKALECGWSWAPSYAATTRWLKQTDKLDDTCARREGPTAYSKRFLPHIEIDYTVLQPGEQYVIDHTRCDFWIREGDVQFRPWLTAMIDARSRLLVGSHLARTPHQDGITATLRMAFRDRAIPERLHLDNGKDFLSSLLTGYTKREANRLRASLGPDWKTIAAHQQGVHWRGILAELGVETIAAIPYSPWSKGLIERWYGTFQDQCSRTFATYCGHDPESRPECLDEIRYDGGDVATLDEARTAVGEWIDLYNHTEHRGEGMDNERPIAVWNRAERLRRASDDALVMLLQGRGVYRVGKNGVAFKVGAKVLTYGGTSVQLRRFAGRDVCVTLDPSDCSYCYAFTADRGDRTLIGRLECNVRIPANTPVEQLREAIRNVRGRRKVMAEAQREQSAMVRTAADEVRAMQANERARQLRATGTDDARPNVSLVRTGFEGASSPPRRQVEPGPTLPDGDDLECFFRNGDDDDDDAPSLSERAGGLLSEPATRSTDDPDSLLAEDDSDTDTNARRGWFDDFLPDRKDADGEDELSAMFDG